MYLCMCVRYQNEKISHHQKWHTHSHTDGKQSWNRLSTMPLFACFCYFRNFSSIRVRWFRIFKLYHRNNFFIKIRTQTKSNAGKKTHSHTHAHTHTSKRKKIHWNYPMNSFSFTCSIFEINASMKKFRFQNKKQNFFFVVISRKSCA